MVLNENLIVALFLLVHFEKNLGFIQRLEFNLTKSIRFDDRLEFRDVELLPLNDETFDGEVDQNFT
jgi:hypothetical protein